jgi:hypothetical protein
VQFIFAGLNTYPAEINIRVALNIKINLDDCYNIETLSGDLTLSKFETVLTDDSVVPIGILISDTPQAFLPDVYNLAFGPIDANGNIDDKIRITHKEHSKVFSTIVLAALTFLTNNPTRYLGIDGSNNARAYMYYRCIQNNFWYLAQHFDISGVNIYV